MTNGLRTFAGAGLAAGLGAVLFGISGAFNAQTVEAQSPPNPPARFAGSVTVDGEPVSAGTVITAYIDGVSCGVTQTFNFGSEARYTLDVEALEPGETTCGTEGATVAFTIGDLDANETGAWRNYDINELNLTADDDDDETPTPGTQTPGTQTPGTQTPGTGTATPPRTGTPRAPSTGLGTTESGSSSMLWVIVALGAGATAFGVGGAAVARRGR